MSVELESAARLNALKQGIEAKTGETYPDLTDGVNALIAGFGQGGGDTSTEDGLITRTLTHYENNRVTQIGASAFNTNTVIEHVSFPSVERLGANAFNGCSALKTINFPNLKAGSGNEFRFCSSLIEAVLPAFEGAAPSFGTCTSLKKVDFGGLLSISNGTFGNCAKLDTVILRNINQINGSTMTVLASVGGFSGTPFAVGGTGGTVYVPAALIEAYKTATNWVTLYEAGTCNFVAIEGSEYE